LQVLVPILHCWFLLFMQPICKFSHIKANRQAKPDSWDRIRGPLPIYSQRSIGLCERLVLVWHLCLPQWLVVFSITNDNLMTSFSVSGRDMFCRRHWHQTNVMDMGDEGLPLLSGGTFLQPCCNIGWFGSWGGGRQITDGKVGKQWLSSTGVFCFVFSIVVVALWHH
jgi:hypothetical protein